MHYYCRECANAVNRASTVDPEKKRENWRRYREKNLEEHRARDAERHRQHRAKERERYRWKNIRRNYGLTKEEYLALWDSQQGACGICGDALAGVKVCVDHDHSTGAVRGLLCNPCNMGLGSFKDDLNRLAGAMKWLQRSMTHG